MVFDGGILREAEEVAIAQGRRTVVTAVDISPPERWWG